MWSTGINGGSAGRQSEPLPRVKIVEEPTAPLLSLEECRLQCEVVPYDENSDGEASHPDDELLLQSLAAAVAHAEAFTGLSIALRTYEMALDSFDQVATGITLPRPPLVEVLSVAAGEGSDATLDPADYIVDEFSTPARLVPRATWRSIAASTNAIRIQYRAGFQTENSPDSGAQMLPANIHRAILLCMAHFYENREDSIVGAITMIPNGFEALLRPMRVRLGMS